MFNFALFFRGVERANCTVITVIGDFVANMLKFMRKFDLITSALLFSRSFSIEHNCKEKCSMEERKKSAIISLCALRDNKSEKIFLSHFID